MALLDAFIGVFVTNLVLAVVILLLGFIIGKLLGSFLRRVLKDVELDRHARGIGIDFSAERLISSLASYLIYFVTIVYSLNVIGVTATVVMFVIALAALIVSVSLILAIKDFFPNLFSGFRIRSSGLFKVGDTVKIREVSGRVMYIGLLETKIVTKSKDTVIIPNVVFTKKQVVVTRSV